MELNNFKCDMCGARLVTPFEIEDGVCSECLRALIAGDVCMTCGKLSRKELMSGGYCQECQELLEPL